MAQMWHISQFSGYQPHKNMDFAQKQLKSGIALISKSQNGD